jgi:hypothetical protein
VQTYFWAARGEKHLLFDNPPSLCPPWARVTLVKDGRGWCGWDVRVESLEELFAVIDYALYTTDVTEESGA